MADLPSLRVTTVAVDDPGHLLAGLPDRAPLAWIRDGDGLAGWGTAARFRADGAERFSRTQRWWARLCAQARVDDSVMAPGTGPVAFASMAFDSDPGASVLVVPQVVIGRRDGKAWATLAFAGDEPPPHLARIIAGTLPSPQPPTGPGTVRWQGGSVPVTRWEAAVSEAISRINRGEFDKVVLARDITGVAEHEIDPRHLLLRLARQFPGCWTFSVDGLVGATPELLVRREGDRITSRVLAGTIRSDADRGEDGRLARALLGSEKDQEEHAYAVRSVAAALAAHCTDLDVPGTPTVLRLANVQHLATDVTGLLADDISALALAASLHPTAAVCGTPTERARTVIRELEGMQRDRYAGPVGWLDSRGDGEFGIALRCGQIDEADHHRIRLFAGCGIVAGSRAPAELAESDTKLNAMRDALISPLA